MNKNPIRVAIIGCGVVGLRRKAFIQKNKTFLLVAMSDIKFKKKFSLLKDIHCYKYYNDILDKDIVDAVFITLPNYLAAKVTMQFLKKNIHVFCEKPPARTLKEIQNVKKIKKEKSKIKLKYGFNHRYHSSIKMAKKIIDERRLGKIINLRCIYGKSKIKTFEIGDWRSKRKYSGGGILLDQGIHMLDLISYLHGDFSEVYSCISNKYWKHNVEDNAFVLLRDKDGVVASLHSTATQWQHQFSMEITFQKGLVDLKGILSGSKSYGKETIKILSRDDISKKNKGKKYFFKTDNSWSDEVNEFGNLIKNKVSKYEGNIFDAEKIMLAIDRIYKADKKWYKYINNQK
jgi:predicted dehydrogenase